MGGCKDSSFKNGLGIDSRQSSEKCLVVVAVEEVFDCAQVGCSYFLC